MMIKDVWLLALALPAGSKFKRAMSDLIAEFLPHGPGSGELEVAGLCSLHP